MMNLLFRIKRRCRWEWHKWIDKIYCRVVTPPFVMSYDECVSYILSNRASITRFGDGELAVIYGHTLGFQEKNAELAIRLRQVLESEVENLLICLPDVFQKLERYNQVEQNFWNSHHYFNRRRWLKSVKSGKSYGNTFYSMEFNQTLAAYRIALLKQIWENRDVVFIEGKDTKMGVGNDLFTNAKSIRRVLCPSKDAFAKYDEIIAGVLEIPSNIEYEWYRMGVTQKIPITGKFSNEAMILGLANKAVIGELRDVVYQEQIIIDLSE